MLKKLLAAGAALTALAVVGSAQAAPIYTIDTFDDYWRDVVNGGTTPIVGLNQFGAGTNSLTAVADSGSQDGFIIGGVRELYLEVTSTGTNSSVQAIITGGPNSAFQHSHSGGIGTSGRSLLTWDGVDDGTVATKTGADGVADLDFGLNLDLSGVGIAFVIEFLAADLNTDDAASSLSLWLYNSADAYAEYVVDLAGLDDQFSPFSLPILLSNPTNVFGDFSLTGVTAIQLDIQGGAQGVQVLIDTAVVTPEPLTVGLFGLGLLGLGAMRRRVAA